MKPPSRTTNRVRYSRSVHTTLLVLQGRSRLQTVAPDLQLHLRHVVRSGCTSCTTAMRWLVHVTPALTQTNRTAACVHNARAAPTRHTTGEAMANAREPCVTTHGGGHASRRAPRDARLATQSAGAAYELPMSFCRNPDCFCGPPGAPPGMALSLWCRLASPCSLRNCCWYATPRASS
jgi:hypothetical protein